jgi:mannitol/fructose-specific phosphotransferase system IIA component (Ntr-type)
MDIKEFLLPNDTATDVRASDKTRLLQELTPSSGPPPESISAEIPKGEDLGSTGRGGAVAIPHALCRSR